MDDLTHLVGDDPRPSGPAAAAVRSSSRAREETGGVSGGLRLPEVDTGGASSLSPPAAGLQAGTKRSPTGPLRGGSMPTATTPTTPGKEIRYKSDLSSSPLTVRTVRHWAASCHPRDRSRAARGPARVNEESPATPCR